MLSLDDIRRRPKVDLHRHLEGALRPATLWDFHQRQRQTRHTSFAELLRAIQVQPGEGPGFQSFLAKFDGLRFRFGDLDALARLAREAVADAAADEVVHLELRFSPVFFLRRTYGQPRPLDAVDDPRDVAAVASAIIEAAQAEARRHGIAVAFIATLGRHLGVAVNQPTADLLHAPVGGSVGALDLAGDEAVCAQNFAPLLQRWQAAGRVLTIHAGEDPHGRGPAAIREALALGATRIGHGVRAIEDAALVAELAARGTTLEICPTSNLQTGVCTDLRTHPLAALLKAGVRVTLNTDDPTFHPTTLSAEYFAALQSGLLDADQLRACVLHAAGAALLPPGERAVLLARLTSAWC